MSARGQTDPIREATLRQLEAANPQIAAFVSAHAGSGKTHVLTGRVIRLLLEGVDPQRILCLTYTRAAAAEMKTRIFKRLSDWIDLDDEGLRQAIYDITGGSLRFDEADSLVRARQLFARALETPGGLKVQTIHAFCERLLKAFPVEAGLPPGFEVLDEKGARELITEARHMVLAGTAPLDPVRLEKLKDDLAALSLRLREETLDELLNELLSHRHRLQPFLENETLLEAWHAVLSAQLGVDDATTNKQQLREAWRAQVLKVRDALDELIAHLDGYSKKTDVERQAQLRQLLALAEGDDVSLLWKFADGLFLTQKGEPRADRSMLTKDVRNDHSGLAQELFDLRDQFYEFAQQERGCVVRDANRALLNAGLAVMETYAALKRRMGVVDYDDLIARTLHLLDPARGDAAWVLYRLDGGIEHVLVDEAQDTSPQQWQIIKRLTEEFCAGRGRYEENSAHLPRTVFAVGDYKQSIYSFQGAEPEVFKEMEAHYRACFSDAGLTFKAVEMSVSFRSAPVILKAVDAVLEHLDPPLIDHGGGGEGHRSAWGDAPGLVEMWLPEVADAQESRSPWAPPDSLRVRENARMRLARRMAQTIRRLIAEGVPVREGPKSYRPVRYGDVLILLRSRSDFMETIISVLKQSGIPVAGADRLKLPDYLAVQDMLALLRFLANREDDLSLACVLKSPLLARDDGRPFDDDDLIALSERGRAEEASLWRRLQNAAKAGRPYTQAVAQLDAWWSEAGFLSPFAFLARVLGRDGGRRRFIERLGEEAAEPLDALLDMARAYEMEHGGAPAGFADWLEMAAPEIRRETDTDEGRRDEVRVMTVHGAKGLEAPVVFLPDTCDDPFDRRKTKIIRVPLKPEELEHQVEIPFWVLSSADRNEQANVMFDAWMRRQLSEHHRLLYVAMTRARDRLYIAAAPSQRAKKEDGDLSDEERALKLIERLPRDSWYRIMLQALFSEGANSAHALRDAAGQLLGWRMAEGDMFRSAMTADQEQTAEAALPEWAMQPVAQPVAQEWLAPSRALRPAGMEEDAAGAVSETERVLSPLKAEQKKKARFGRGRIIHRLLELLPEIAPETREERALAWLMRPPRSLSHQEAQDIWGEVKRLLDNPDYAALFGPDSRAEVPLAARIASADGEMMVAGQIDRLVVTEREVIVADYKTMRPPPKSIDKVPEDHIRQLALYALAMRSLWPDRPVRALLIYTAEPEIIEIPPERLKAAAKPPQR
ncbi:double-strand break repair helicase AddA [Thermopetrobacter sp. TC1]|uniref:double-strand break repair helicase AddA n=1 Tax=Thermopetrobacter sp. TC1 TaxID=1495045 RepID=UPI00056F1768|nr:double-strand break repair helicase AddA [Thermopetrobacter sp. TC1]